MPKKNSRGLESMVNFIGENKLKFQILSNAMSDIHTIGDESKITFVTESENLNATHVMTGNGGKIGIVIWVDKDDYFKWHTS